MLQAKHVLVTESGRSSVELVDSCLARGKVLLVLTLLLVQISLDLKCARTLKTAIVVGKLSLLLLWISYQKLTAHELRHA